MKTALRSLLTRDRTFTVIALITLALTIGANSAIFSVINSVLLQPLPYPEPDRLVILYNTYPGVGVDKGANGSLDYFDRRELTDHFEDLSLIAFGSAAMGLDGAPERFPVQRSTPELFTLLRTQPMLGRTYTEEELEPGKDKVAVITHELWQRALGGDPDAIGETIHLDGDRKSVV